MPTNESDKKGGSACGVDNELFVLAYDELRQLAAGIFRNERPGHTLQPTALVHEVFARLARDPAVVERGHTYLMGAAARAMTRILIEHARHRNRSNHGGDQVFVELRASDVSVDPIFVDLIDLADALEALEAAHPKPAAVVTYRFLGGMSMSAVARHVGCSREEVSERWEFGRAWLKRRFGHLEDEDARSG